MADRDGAQFLPLRDKGFPILALGVESDLTVGITIVSTDPAVHEALLTELGPRPWKVHYGPPYVATPKSGDG